MAAGVDAIAVFYEDGTYALETWADRDKVVRPVGRNGRFVVVTVYHVQTPNDLPNAVAFTDDRVGIKKTPSHLIAHAINEPPASGDDVRESAFREGSSEQTIADAAAGGSGMDLVLISLPASDPNYNDLNNRANDKVNELRSAAVPSSGTY